MLLHAQNYGRQLLCGDPLQPGMSGGSQPEPEELRRPLGGNVLIVEDDEAIRETLADILQYEGYLASAASDGREALLRLQGGGLPDLILLDLMMPRMNGWEFRAAQLTQQEFAGIPVVVLSGAHDADRQAILLNASGCLRKPIEVVKLLEIVRLFCG